MLNSDQLHLASKCWNTVCLKRLIPSPSQTMLFKSEMEAVTTNSPISFTHFEPVKTGAVF